MECITAASCVTLTSFATSFFASELNVDHRTFAECPRCMLSSPCERETFLFRMARNLITFLSRKRQKMFFFLAHITWELDDSDDDDHESEWNFSFSRSIFYAKSPLFHESCPRLILWDTSFHSFAQRRLHELCIKISNWF